MGDAHIALPSRCCIALTYHLHPPPISLLLLKSALSDLVGPHVLGQGDRPVCEGVVGEPHAGSSLAGQQQDRHRKVPGMEPCHRVQYRAITEPDTEMGSVLATRARYYYFKYLIHLLKWKVSLLIGPDTTFTRIESVFANRAGYYIFWYGKFPW